MRGRDSEDSHNTLVRLYFLCFPAQNNFGNTRNPIIGITKYVSLVRVRVHRRTQVGCPDKSGFNP